ncbi:MAG: glycosyltransferase family 39 protein [Armatimonadota bacterium]|nr:MAG: glycosyltransferase family 39 protein [Armatimonadota bacterium]
MAISGLGDWVARLPMAVASTLTIPLAHILGRQLLGGFAGLSGAFWLATAARSVAASRTAFLLSDQLFFLMAGVAVYVWTRRGPAGDACAGVGEGR